VLVAPQALLALAVLGLGHDEQAACTPAPGLQPGVELVGEVLAGEDGGPLRR
jgi:hypothetical protein